MAPGTQASGQSSSGSPSGSVELNAADWQNVMQGVLHPNTQSGDSSLSHTIRGFSQSGKLSDFKSRIQYIQTLIDQAEQA